MPTNTPKNTLLWAGFHGLAAVALGAFAAHGLKNRLEPELLQIFEVGARYEMYGALGLLGFAALSHKVDLKSASLCLALGTLVFSGSLYALALSGIRAFGAVTPLGGLLMLAAWGLLLWRAYQMPKA